VKLAAGVLAYLVCAMTFFVIWWKRMPVVEIDGERRVLGWSDHGDYVPNMTYTVEGSVLTVILFWWFVIIAILIRTGAAWIVDVITFIPFKLISHPTWYFTTGWNVYSQSRKEVIYEYVDKQNADEIAHLTLYSEADKLQMERDKLRLGFPKSTRE